MPHYCSEGPWQQSCRYYMGLQKSEMGFNWFYRKVIGITEGFRKERAQSCLGFSRDSRKCVLELHWDYGNQPLRGCSVRLPRNPKREWRRYG